MTSDIPAMARTLVTADNHTDFPTVPGSGNVTRTVSTQSGAPLGIRF